MNRITITVAAIAASLLALPACGGNDAPDTGAMERQIKKDWAAQIAHRAETLTEYETVSASGVDTVTCIAKADNDSTCVGEFWVEEQVDPTAGVCEPEDYGVAPACGDGPQTEGVRSRYRAEIKVDVAKDGRFIWRVVGEPTEI
jgi:hypothetical protein